MTRKSFIATLLAGPLALLAGVKTKAKWHCTGIPTRGAIVMSLGLFLELLKSPTHHPAVQDIMRRRICFVREEGGTYMAHTPSEGMKCIYLVSARLHPKGALCGCDYCYGWGQRSRPMRGIDCPHYGYVWRAARERLT